MSTNQANQTPTSPTSIQPAVKLAEGELPQMTREQLEAANAQLGPLAARQSATDTAVYGLGALGAGALALTIAQQIKAKKKLQEKDLFKQSDSDGPVGWATGKITEALTGGGHGSGASIGDYLIPSLPLAAGLMATPSIMKAIREAYPEDAAKDRLKRVKKKYDQFISERLLPKTASATPMFHGMLDAMVDGHEKRAFISWPTFWGLAGLAGIGGFAQQHKYEGEYSKDVIKTQAAADAIKRWRMEQPHRLRIIAKTKNRDEDVDGVDENTVAVDLPEPKAIAPLPEKAASNTEIKEVYELCKSASIDFDGLRNILNQLTPAQKQAALKHGIRIERGSFYEKSASMDSVVQWLKAGINSPDQAKQEQALNGLNTLLAKLREGHGIKGTWFYGTGASKLGIENLLPPGNGPIDINTAKQWMASPAFDTVAQKVYAAYPDQLEAAVTAAGGNVDPRIEGTPADPNVAPGDKHKRPQPTQTSPGGTPQAGPDPNSTDPNEKQKGWTDFSGKQLGIGGALALLGALGIGSGNTSLGVLSFLGSAITMFGPQVLEKLGIKLPDWANQVVDWLVDRHGRPSNAEVQAANNQQQQSTDDAERRQIEADNHPSNIQPPAQTPAQPDPNSVQGTADAEQKKLTDALNRKPPVAGNQVPPPVNPAGEKPVAPPAPVQPAAQAPAQPPVQQQSQGAPQMPPPTVARPAVPNPLEKKPFEVTQTKPINPNPAKIAAALIKAANLPKPEVAPLKTMPKPQSIGKFKPTGTMSTAPVSGSAITANSPTLGVEG